MITITPAHAEANITQKLLSHAHVVTQLLVAVIVCLYVNHFLGILLAFLSPVVGGNNYDSDSVDMDTDGTSTPAVAVVAPNNSKVIFDSPRADKTQPSDADDSGGAVYSNTETIQRR